jgi:dienelactone hydrolase
MSLSPNERTGPQIGTGSESNGEKLKSTLTPAVDIARQTHEVLTESSATGWCLGCEATFTAADAAESHVRATAHLVRLESASLSWLAPGADGDR